MQTVFIRGIQYWW